MVLLCLDITGYVIQVDVTSDEGLMQNLKAI